LVVVVVVATDLYSGLGQSWLVVAVVVEDLQYINRL
jgi:hypothetical protein